MTNPYTPAVPDSSAADASGERQQQEVHRSRWLTVSSLVLAGFAVVIGWIHLTPLLHSPLATWGWQNWAFGFAPAGYVVFAAVVAVVIERFPTRWRLLALPLWLSPLLLVTGLIVYAIRLDFANIVAGRYSFSQNLHTAVIGLLCPVVWFYIAAATARSIRVLRPKIGR